MMQCTKLDIRRRMKKLGRLDARDRHIDSPGSEQRWKRKELNAPMTKFYDTKKLKRSALILTEKRCRLPAEISGVYEGDQRKGGAKWTGPST